MKLKSKKKTVSCLEQQELFFNIFIAVSMSSILLFDITQKPESDPKSIPLDFSAEFPALTNFIKQLFGMNENPEKMLTFQQTSQQIVDYFTDNIFLHNLSILGLFISTLMLIIIIYKFINLCKSQKERRINNS